MQWALLNPCVKLIVKESKPKIYIE